MSVLTPGVSSTFLFFLHFFLGFFSCFLWFQGATRKSFAPPVSAHRFSVHSFALWRNGQCVGLLSICVKQFKGCGFESHQSHLLSGILAKTATAPSWQDGKYLSSVYFVYKLYIYCFLNRQR